MRRMGIALQLYTLREPLAEDFKGTVRRVAEIGYEGVEFAGYGGLSAEEMKRLLEETGLRAVGSHVSLKALRDNLQGEIAYAKTIGAGTIACPWLPVEQYQTEEAWTSLFKELESIGAECRKHGIVFCYHNHAFEFEQRVGGQFVFDALYGSTSPDSVQVEMDVCWVHRAGQDPLAYIARYAGRLPLVHFKDYAPTEDGTFYTKELGRGIVPLADVLKASSDAGAEWLVVEQDSCRDNPPLVSAANSFNWLREHYLAKL